MITINEYVTLALQNCMDTMIDCLYYYHMTNGKPELTDFIKENDRQSIKDYYFDCLQELQAKYELLYLIFPNKKISDIMKEVYGGDSDNFYLMEEFYRIFENEFWLPMWTDCDGNPRLQNILSKYKTL